MSSIEPNSPPLFEHINDRHHRIAAWFLGPKAENADFLRNFFESIAKQTKDARLAYKPNDPKFIPAEIQATDAFQGQIVKTRKILSKLSEDLAKYSIPFWSPRYNAHMTYDTSMPALLGYLSTTLFNPNNVATEGSPFTSVVEKVVGIQLCAMLGYDTTDVHTSRSAPWGHITCGGSIANLESMWAARNLKFYPLSLACALEPGAPLASIRDDFMIELCTGEKKLFSKADTWDLLNLKPETVFEIPERLEDEFGVSSTSLSEIMNNYLIQSLGKDVLEKKFGITEPMKYFVGTTKHYSWPKGAAITGIGSKNIIDIPVDINARLDPAQLDQLLHKCLEEKRAVYAVVAIMGSTEQGAVDPLKDVVDLRNKYQKLGLSFAIHADAAWGGYFASLLREEVHMIPADPNDHYVPELALSKHTRTQLGYLKHADSITIDPHKSGYIPYPAGGLCYRDGRMRFLVTWLNPDVYKDSDADTGMGVYGVEGSKPGAAPVAAWVSHEVIGLHKNGYGSLLGEAMFSCTKMYTHWLTMDMDDPYLIVIPLNPTLAEREGGDEEDIRKQREYVRKYIVNRPNIELVEDKEAMKLVRELGSDLSINAFACNFKLENGEANQDIVEANYLNTRIYERLSVTKIDETMRDKPLFIMSTTMVQSAYGVCCDRLKKHLKLVGKQDLEILVNCVMSPFPTVANFAKELADSFKEIAHEEIKVCLLRNTITAASFRFVIQGTDKPYLTLLPMFNMANYRHQLILSCDLPQEVLEIYRAERAKEPSSVFYISTTKDVKLESILHAGSFEAMLEKQLPTKDRPVPPRFASDFQVTNIEVLKNSPIDSKYLDPAFPEYMYFYLYGTKEQQHIEHMLVSSKNVQLTSDQVKLDLTSGSVPEADLANGLILRLDNVHENIVLPLLPPNTPKFFQADRQLKVSIFKDPHPADAHGPGLISPLSTAQPIASGTMTLGKMVYFDSVLLNGNPRFEKREDPQGVPLAATQRDFVPEDLGDVDPYYKRRDTQYAWRRYWEQWQMTSNIEQE